jgi:hypothetical protein
MNEDPFVDALSRVADKCADCKDDWTWLENPSVKGDRDRVIIFRFNLRDVARHMIDERPTGEEIFHQLRYRFFQILYRDPVAHRIDRMAFRDWIERLAESLGWKPAAIRPVAAPAAPSVIKMEKKDAIPIESDDEEEEGDRDDDNGSSPMSFDSSSPVVPHEASLPRRRPDPLSEMPPDSPPQSVSLGAADPMMDDDTPLSRPADPPRRSPSQTERQDAFERLQEAVQGVPIVVLPSSQSAAALSEPQSEDPVQAFERHVSPPLMELAHVEHKEAEQAAAAVVAAAIEAVVPAQVERKSTGGKRGPEAPLAEPTSRKAKTKRQKTTTRRLSADQKTALESPRTTRSADKIKTRAYDTSSLPIVAGWSDIVVSDGASLT